MDTLSIKDLQDTILELKTELDTIKKLESELSRAIRYGKSEACRHVSSLRAAFDGLPKAENAKGGGVILTITDGDDFSIITPVFIRGGLSPQSIKALRVDICRAFERETTTSPAMADFYAEISEND